MNHNPLKFNLAQLCTWEDAIKMAKILTAARIGTGISDSHGIYRPEFLPGPSAFEEPNFFDDATGKAHFHLHFRFKNGVEGVNAGLCLDLFKRYPQAPHYVIAALGAQINKP